MLSGFFDKDNKFNSLIKDRFISISSSMDDIYFFFSLTNPLRGLVNHTRRVCPEGVKRPRRVPVEKKTRRQFWPKSRLKWPKLYAHVYAH